MHGIIFLYLQKFAQRQGSSVWDDLHAAADIPKRSYSAVKEYPDEVALALVGAASRLLNLPAPAVLEAFGEFLAPELLSLYGNLLKPEWKTLDVIANTEELIHTAVRARNPGAKPPTLECLRTSPTELQIMYSSPRKLCSLAKGIVRGLGRHFDETIEIEDEACMLTGDPFCAMRVTQTDAAHSLIDAPTTITPGQTLIDASGVRQANPPAEIGKSGDIFSFVARPGAYLEPPRRAGEIGRLGHYRVLELLGQGGMAQVFRATDVRLERLVALKILRPEMVLQTEMQQRFLREARALAAVRSDHVVTVFEVGVASDVPFLAMEFLEGETLLAYHDRHGGLPLASILRIGREIAVGLAAAHAKGFVHRDIKPANVWIEAASGRVKLLDFGLARIGSEAEPLSQAGLVLGTPGFMAPEQANGQPVDFRSDLFSLGCVMYWLCTCERPFPGADVLSMLTSLATHQPQELSQRVPTLPAELCRLVSQLLEKDPARRPESSAAVAETLLKVELSAAAAPSSVVQ